MTSPVSSGSHSQAGVRHRSKSTLFFITAGALLLFVGFIALGCWQVYRLSWKTQLIARVEQRVHAPAVDAPLQSRWAQVNAESDEYRHVKLSGVLMSERTTGVLASTVLGRGYWLMTPMQRDSGGIVWINRGFVTENAKPADKAADQHREVVGLLRISEPGGAFLHHNDPANQRWYSRDLKAMSAALQLQDVAPFFIDEEADPLSPNTGADTNHPVAGLTVITFNNNHLVYSITWFALAAMMGGAFYYVVARGSRRRRAQDGDSRQP